ncbi:MAG TPA: CoA pyrophosphatase [Miltoncostaeaceae bacterium]|nr:CoA pyrophosphatase [Miltoncostaeaceae bacterium]
MSPAAPTPPSPRVPRAAALADALAHVLRDREPASLPGPGRRAAVLIVLADRAGQASLLLTKRSDDMPTHPGQISLPGGVVDPGDPSPEAAALRETEEEVGLPRAALRVVGELDDVHTMASNFIIRPFVALLEGRWEPVPSDAEVARAFHVPVAEVLRADAVLPADPAPLALRYPLGGEDVWGATARILRIFSVVLRQALVVSPRGGAAPAAPAGADPAG